MYFQKIKTKITENKTKSIIILIAVILVGYFGYKNIFSTTGETSYVVGYVQRGTVVSSISGTGQVSSSQQVDLKSKASGDIIRTYVQAGQKVKAGDILAEVDSRDARLALESAQIAYDKLTQPVKPEDVASAESTLNRSYNDGWNSVSSIFIAYPDMLKKMNDMFYTTGGYLFDSNNQADSARAYIQKAGANFDKAKISYDTVLKEYNSLTRTSATSSINLLIEDTHQMVKQTIDAVKDAQSAVAFITNLTSDNSAAASTAASNVNSWVSTLNSELSNLLSAQGSIISNTTSLNNLMNGADVYDVRSQAVSLEQKRNAYNDSFIRAPFDGIVGRMSVKVGDNVGSGTTVATMITTSQMADISLNEVDAAKVKIGDKVTLSFDAIDGLVMTGKISEIDLVGTVTQGVVTYNTKIAFDTDDSRVLPGMSVSASIITDVSADTLVVPVSAVKTDARGSYIQMFNPPLVVATSTTSIGTPSKTAPDKVYVQTGLSNDTLTEVLSGTNENDQIVTRIIAPSTTTTTAAPSLLGGNTRGVTGGATRPATGR